MRRLDGRNDALGAAQALEGVHGLRVRHGRVLRASGVVKPCVLRPHTRVVETRADRVRGDGLAPFVLHHVGASTVQHAGRAPSEACGMPTGLDPVATGLESPQPHGGIVQERREDAHGIGASADTGGDGIGKSPCRGEDLLACLLADDRLEGAHHRREGARSGDRAQDVVGLVDGRDPVAHGLVDRVLESAAPGGDGDDRGPEESHARDVERLAPGVLFAHVDDALQPEQCRRGGGRHAMLTGPGLGNDPLLAHPHGEERLPQDVVDLVRAGVIEVLALEIDARAAAVLLPEAHGLGEGARAPDVGALQPLELGMETRVRHRLREGLVQAVERRRQGLRDEAPAVGTEVTLRDFLTRHDVLASHASPAGRGAIPR